MCRERLREIGVGNKIRIIGQYKHKAYDRLLLTNVALLSDYIELGKDIYDERERIIYGNYWHKMCLTDHVHLDVTGVDDRRVTNASCRDVRNSGDILICTCEVYKYQYSGGSTNYGIKSPSDVILLTPVFYEGKVVFISHSATSRTTYWRYVGYGSRMSASSYLWDFSKLQELPRQYTYTSSILGETQEHDGYAVTWENEGSYELYYPKQDTRLTVYKTIRDAVIAELGKNTMKNTEMESVAV